MKKILLIALTFALLGCQKDIKEEYAIITGTITNKPLGELTINSYDRTFTKTLTPSEDGTFTDTLSMAKSSYVLFDGKTPVFLYVEPGYHLTINYDGLDFENSLEITGKGAEANNYLLAKSKSEKELLGNRFDTYLMDEEDFKAKFKAVKTSHEALLNSTQGLSENFKALEKNNINYGYLARINEYEGYHRYMTKNDTFKVSEGFLQDLDNLDYNNESDYLFSQDYKMLVTNHYQKLSAEHAEAASIENDIAFLNTLADLENSTIKNDLLFQLASNNMGYSKDVDAFYNLYLKHSTNEKNNAIIKENYLKLTLVAKGKPSPKFIDYENYKGGTTSLDDLKGKYVYIDVWATWCGPCKREIPYLKEVEKKFHNSNIEFVSVSIDKLTDRNKWKSMVADKQLGGMQLMADNDWNSAFVKGYQIQGIPRFILIDPQGNIVDPNAPRPSDPALETLLNSEPI